MCQDATNELIKTTTLPSLIVLTTVLLVASVHKSILFIATGSIPLGRIPSDEKPFPLMENAD